MANPEARKLLDDPWAINGDRTDPDDASLDPTLSRATGWPAPFSATDGNTPRREVVNQLVCELSAAAIDGMREGLRQYDANVNYRQHARVAVDAREFRAARANGPDETGGAVSPTAPGQTAWVEVTGVVGAPSAPAAPQATAPRSGELDWFWMCPRDGGATILRFEVQWRPQGDANWSPSQFVTTPRFVLQSLTNGTTYELQVKAHNSAGESGWSAIGQATAAGTVPGGGATLALRGEPGNTEGELDWLEPDDGGVDITGYTVQWRTAGQAYSSGRQMSVTETMATVTGLVNGTEYFFQVRAENGQGSGAWSNEASTTPVAPVPSQAIPDRAAAPQGTAGNEEGTWAWAAPSDNGADISGYEWRFRETGTLAWTTRTLGAVASRTETGLDNGTTYEAQVRAINSVGTATEWSPSGELTPAAEVPDQVQLVVMGQITNGMRASWGVPEANGSDLVGYDVRVANNAAFVAPTTTRVTGTSFDITGVSDGQTRYVRVRAVNGVGDGAWSPDASLERDDGVGRPSAPDAPEGMPRRPLIVDWAGSPNLSNGAAFSAYQFQWRYAGDAWAAGNIIDADECFASHEVADTTKAVEGRWRCQNSDGWSDWSEVSTVAASALLAARPQSISIPLTTAAPYSWPYSDLRTAILATTAGSGLSRNGAVVHPTIPGATTRVWVFDDLTTSDTFTVSNNVGDWFVYPQPLTG